MQAKRKGKSGTGKTFKSRKEFYDRFKLKEKDGERIVSLSKQERRICAIRSDIKKKISSIPREAEFAGRLIGKDVRGRFSPSLSSIERAASSDDARKVSLDRRSSWLFLCGRDIFSSSLKGGEPEKGYVFIMNENRENLGMGLFDGKMIINISDKGDFLRREG